MHNAVWKALLLSSVTSLAHAVPNYYSPQNIIAAAEQGNPYWFFRLDADKIAIARQYAAMKTELLERVARELAQYRQSAQDRAKEQPLDAQTAQAMAVLEKSYAELRKELETVSTGQKVPKKRSQVKSYATVLTAEDRDKLEALLSKSPSDLLAPTTALRKQPIGASRPSLIDFKRRAEVEKKYAAFMEAFNGYALRFVEDKELVARVRRHLETAYASIIETESLQI